VYLTQNIDSMSAGGTSSILVGEDFMTQRKTTLAEGASMKASSLDTSSSSVEDVRRTDKHFGIEGKAELSGGLKWGVMPSVSLSGSVAVGGGYGRTSTHTEMRREGHEDETRIESAINLTDGREQSESQRIKRERELIEGFTLGKYHLRFTVGLKNRNPNDTLVVRGNDMRAYLSGPGLPGEIPVPYREREEIRLGYGETLCVFDYVITDRKQFESLLRLGNQGELQLLGLKVSGADFPVFSSETGNNILDEQAKWERNHPSTLVSIGFGDLAGLSPWRVSRKHTKETGRRGTPVTVREALLAVGGVAETQSETLPEDVFTFSDKGHLATVVDRPLLDRDDNGNYRMFAVLLTKEKGKAEPHLPLPEVMNRNIKDYSEISLFDFTLDEFAQNAVLLPAYFAEVKREIEGWLGESGEKEALQYLKDALAKRQREDDDRDLPKDRGSITASDVERFKLRAEAGVTNMQYKLARCLLDGWGVESNHVDAIKWFRKAAEQGHAEAQNVLGNCYYSGVGVTQDYAEAVKWYRKAAEQGLASAQNHLGLRYANGEGVAQDYAEAVKWYRKAAELGDDWAQWKMGECYKYGRGVAKDNYEAVKWYRKAANQGNEFGQISLAKCYYYGHGVTKNLDEAKSLLLKAIAQGSNDAKTYMRNWFGE
jgi:TPR repeat protein